MIIGKMLMTLIAAITLATMQFGSTLASSNNPDDIAPKEKILSACNVAAYQIEMLFFDAGGDQISKIRLLAGRCDDFGIELPENGAFVYARAIQSASLDRLKKYSTFRKYWNGNPAFGPGGSNKWACLHSNSGKFVRFKSGAKCSQFETTVELGYLAGNAPRFALFFEDPFLCKQIDPNCSDMDGNLLLSWASDLERSLEISLRAWTDINKTYGLIPTASGLETMDHNGPFTRGILVTEQQAPRTPLGSPVPAETGDVIVLLNGQPMFDRDDFIMVAIEHGAQHGYEKPYEIEFIRNGRQFTAEGYFVFHRGIYGSFFLNDDGSCRNKTRAILSSSLEEATFYTKPILACVNYDINNYTIQRRYDCEFAVRQLTAGYRQYCPNLTQAGAIVGSIFMPGRGAAESVVQKLAVKNLGRLIPALVVEATEELARAMITLPPGIQTEGNWGSIGQQIGFGMAIGTGVRLITFK